MPIEPAPFGSPYSSDHARDPEALVLRDYFAVLLASKKFILAAMIAGGVVAGVFALSRPTYFTAAALLLADEKRGAIADPTAMRAVIDSHTFQSAVEQKLAARASDGFDLTIESIPGTRLLRLHAKSRTRETAAHAANAGATELVAMDERLSRADARAAEDLVETQLKEAQKRAQELRAQLEKFPQIEVLSGGGTRTDGSGLVHLLVELEGEKARLSAATEQLKRTPRALAAQPPRRDTEALVEHAARSTRPPPPQSSQQQSAEGQPAAPPQMEGPLLFNDTTNPVHTVLEYQASVSRNRIAQLQRERDATMRLLNLSGGDVDQLRQLYAKRLEMRRLQTEYDLAQRIYVDARARWEQARIDSASRPTRLQVLDTARPPAQSAPRNVGLTVAIGLFVSGVLAAAIVLVSPSGRRTRRTPARI